ncbi:MAG: hypothetical protein M3463_09590 [Verrucomicrobiota bacterium]|nr:hypothetical protein [Verrucomicrobiota bacterium]
MVLTAALGFAAGAGIARISGNRQPMENISASAERRSAEASDEKDPARARSPRNDEARVARLFSALQERGRLRQRSELFEALQGLQPGDLPALVDHVEKLRDGYRGKLLPMVLERWFQADSSAAGAWVKAHAGDREVLHEWARHAPESALEEACRNLDSEKGRYFGRMALMFMGIKDPKEADPKEAVMKLLALPPALTDGLLANTVVDWARKDPHAAFAFLPQIPAGKQRDAARDGVLIEWARRDPAQALARASELLPSLKPSLIGHPLLTRLAEAAAAKDPRAALQWVTQLPEEFRTNPAIAAAQAWAKTEPVAALNWSLANGVDVARGVRTFIGQSGGSVLKEAMLNRPEETVAWVKAQPPGPDRDRIVERALHERLDRLSREKLFTSDREYVFDLFRELPEEALVRTAADLGRRRAERGDFTDVDAWAKNFELGPARAEAIATAVQRRGSAREDELLATAKTSADRDAALRGLAGAMISRAPAAAAARAAEIRDPAVRRDTLEGVVRDWSR